MSSSKHDPHTGLTELLALLAAARRRLVVRRSLSGTVWSALAAAIVVALLRVATLAAPMPALGPGTEWRWVGAVLTIGILLTAAWVWRSRPDLIEMARRADGCFDLDERLSTAVELGARHDRAAHTSPVVAALFHDAMAHAASVDPRRLVPIGIPRPAFALALVVTGILVLQLTSPVDRATLQSDASILATATDPEAESAADLILDIAELIQEEAERQSNDDLRVVATSLEQLAADVVEQGSGGGEVSSELSRLLGLAEAASSVSESNAEADGFSMTLASIEEWLEAEGERELVARADANSRELSGPEAPPAGPLSVAERMMARARETLSSVRAALTGEVHSAESLADELAAADSAGRAATAGAIEGEMSTALPMEALVAGARPLANVEIGAGSAISDEPSGGESPTLGIGGGSANVTAERVEVPDVGSSRDFELPTEGGSRRRLPEEIVPQTRFTEVVESDLPLGDWRQTTQAQVTSGYLGVSYRDVVSRYFLGRIRQAEVASESIER